MNTKKRDRKRLKELLGRPLLQEEADELEALAARLDVPLQWKHNDLKNEGWQDGRK